MANERLVRLNMKTARDLAAARSIRMMFHSAGQ